MSTSSLPPAGFSAEQETYIGWLATPTVARSPETALEIAQKLGVDETILAGWRLLPGLMESVRKRTLEMLGERFADVVRKIEEEAATGSINHQRLYLSLLRVGHEEGEPAAQTNVKVLVGVDLKLVGNATVAVPREQ